jgi:predicted Fe-Mo cluster-binding NifX family protein
MKIAFTVWNDRVAPLFDVARQVHVVESIQGRIVNQFRAPLEGPIPAGKARQLTRMGVQTLVCGAISRSLQYLVIAYGIELIAFINGDLQEVIDAWQRGELRRDAFLMPGCKGRFRKGPHGGFEEAHMFSDQRGGSRGQGGGKGSRGQGRGRKGAGGPGAASDLCQCPRCGHQEPHQRGVPCMQMACAKCGTPMTRKLQQ